MKGVILAAGMGTRLGSLTKHKPKCMVEYRGKPLIEWVLEAMEANGISEIAVVDGYKREALRIPPSVKRYTNPNYEGTNMVYSLFCARSWLDGDVIVSYGDIAYTPDVLRVLIESPGDIVVNGDLKWLDLWRQRMEDPLKDAESFKYDDKGNLIEVGRKCSSYKDIQAQFMGLIKFSNNALPLLFSTYDSLEESEREQMYTTDFLNVLIGRGADIKVSLIQGGWVEIDTKTDLDVEIV